MQLHGNPVSPGIALGEVLIYRPINYEVAETYIEQGRVSVEKARFYAGLTETAKELDVLIATFECSDPEKGKIFAAHKEILLDEEISEMAIDAISDDKCTADLAVQRVFEEFIQMLSRAKDAMIAARVADLRDVRNRLLRVLRCEPERNLSALAKPVILVAHDLLPSDTATLDRKNILGILTEIGGATSHSAIIARSYRIPAVLGVADCTNILHDGDFVAMDATDGAIHHNPTIEVTKGLSQKREVFLEDQRQMDTYLTREPLLADGHRVEIGINIGSPDETEGYASSSFVGLFRTEFLYMESDHMPTEEEQFSSYRRVIAKAAGKPVTLRTLDIGGDKTLSYLPMPHEENPFLGERALRLCLANVPIFKTQLRAALRASADGPLWLMLPMVGSMDDIHRAKAVVEEVKAELDSQGVAYGSDVKLGIMIEIPSIAMIADLAAKEVDFASVGTNDLTQYLCAVDRMNPALTGYYQSLSPAMVRTLGIIIEAFNQVGKPISVCGELAGDPAGALILTGLGLKKLSMSPSNIARVKGTLACVTLEEAQMVAQSAKNAATEVAVQAAVKELLDRKKA